MKVVEKTGKTVEEAVGQALQNMGVSIDDVEVEIIEEPTKGILGLFGAKPARVKVILKEGASEKAVDLLNNIIKSMELQVELDVVEKKDFLTINLKGPELGILIGRRGETLDALQFLVNLSVNKNKEVRRKIIIDVEGYRHRREETLQKLAVKLANKAKQRGRSVVLEPMSSQERRIIHTALQGRDDIYTFSEGDEPYRKIIISPKK
ncbi:RNA-binding cell elongation regulator Jag/EloR [Pelotomaculum sp. PtaB.Bin117]|uniref:RNA-binding cell elongation regulator Jag/EloR n=1 Tax=Pelotomaculum sp. PtaB.Bin117 TaxID=1811694 RepID=UPI0009CEC1B7|nr:RNA-binding cell elongation regulator Jag/EloR [Pelotomaculum sp. PtaB.Bin117]OPX85716.1 MAG: R3H domain protein [Pelotomaculum sp. PtaB.Bin117]OPY61412.1 MAG: R3H domain protein [Pelotomaculum sp. PtaU1.Bin065]